MGEIKSHGIMNESQFRNVVIQLTDHLLDQAHTINKPLIMDAAEFVRMYAESWFLQGQASERLQNKTAATKSVATKSVSEVSLNELFVEISKAAIVTLDTEPVGVDSVKNIPVGRFVRLQDVRSIFSKYKEKTNV